jgi:hypothetical protein
LPVTGSVGDAAIVNLTPVLESAPGNGQLVSSDVSNPPVASNVNFRPAVVDPNVAVARIGSDGQVCFVNSRLSSVHLVADHLGIIAASAYTPAQTNGAPDRKVDTRQPLPVYSNGPADLPGKAIPIPSIIDSILDDDLRPREVYAVNLTAGGEGESRPADCRCGGVRRDGERHDLLQASRDLGQAPDQPGVDVGDAPHRRSDVRAAPARQMTNQAIGAYENAVADPPPRRRIGASNSSSGVGGWLAVVVGGIIATLAAALDRLEVGEISARFLSRDERIAIADLHGTGVSVREIARQLGRAPSTISRELRRNASAAKGYRPFEAHRCAIARRAPHHRRRATPTSSCDV